MQIKSRRRDYYDGLQRSLMDKTIRNVFKSHGSALFERDYRKLWGNDELFYNGPGFNIPTCGIGRLMHREYHFHTDNLDNLSRYHMTESIWFLARVSEVFETDFIPQRNFIGPVYQSRYNLYVDPIINAKGAENILRIEVMMDGNRSCMDIAVDLDLDFFFVRDWCSQLAEKGLVSKKERMPKNTDAGTSL